MKNTLILLLTVLSLFGCQEKKYEPLLLQNNYEEQIKQLKLPEGFQIEVVAEIQNARSMTRNEDGSIIFIGNRRAKEVYALSDRDLDGVFDRLDTIAKDWNMPNGVAYHKGDLFVAEVSRIHRFKSIADNLEQPKSDIIYDSFPTETHHGWKFIAIGPDDKLYVPVGAPCNICLEENPIYASITRMNIDGTGLEIVANGVRNTVGFDWHPQTGKLWFTDNGRDMLGDNSPACELNRIDADGEHFGFPFIHQGDLLDPEFGNNASIEDYTPPVFKFEPHSAPLGMRFYQGTNFPKEYLNAAFVAQHGSWNRSEEAGHTGYQIRAVFTDSDKVTGSEVFIEGWLDKQTNERWGRPVDVLELPNGALLISDDYLNVIYKVTYTK